MRSHIRNQELGSEGIFFLVGKSTNSSDLDVNDERTADLKSEIAFYGDFIIGDYVDSYRNLALKTFSDRDQQKLSKVTKKSVDPIAWI